MSLFDIHISKLIETHLHDKLRRERFLAWMAALLSPVKSLYASFWMNRNVNLYNVSHGQYVSHIEAVLNDNFDSGFRRIYITDADNDFEPVYSFLELEEKPLFVFLESEDKPVYLFTEYENITGGVDFVVNIPVGIPYDENRMKALVNYFKTPGMEYEIRIV